MHGPPGDGQPSSGSSGESNNNDTNTNTSEQNNNTATSSTSAFFSSNASALHKTPTTTTTATGTPLASTSTEHTIRMQPDVTVPSQPNDDVRVSVNTTTHNVVPTSIVIPSSSSATQQQLQILPTAAAITVREVAYIPLALARRAVDKIQTDMVAMRARHQKALAEVVSKFASVEESTRAQFSAFSVKTRQDVQVQMDTLKQSALATEAEALELRQRLAAVSKEGSEASRKLQDTLSAEHATHHEEEVHLKEDTQRAFEEVEKLKKETQRLAQEADTMKHEHATKVKELEDAVEKAKQAGIASANAAAAAAAANAILSPVPAAVHVATPILTTQLPMFGQVTTTTTTTTTTTPPVAAVTAAEGAKKTAETAATAETVATAATAAQQYALTAELAARDKALAALEAENSSLLQMRTSLQARVSSLEASLLLASSSSSPEGVKSASEKQQLDDDGLTSSSTTSAKPSSSSPSSTTAAAETDAKYISTMKRMDPSRLGPALYAGNLQSLITHTKGVIKSCETDWVAGKKREALRAYQKESSDVAAVLPSTSAAHSNIHTAQVESESKIAEGAHAKAAFALKQGLERFVAETQAELDALKNAFGGGGGESGENRNAIVTPISSSVRNEMSPQPSAGTTVSSENIDELQRRAAEAETKAAALEAQLLQAMQDLTDAKNTVNALHENHEDGHGEGDDEGEKDEDADEEEETHEETAAEAENTITPVSSSSTKPRSTSTPTTKSSSSAASKSSSKPADYTSSSGASGGMKPTLPDKNSFAATATGGASPAATAAKLKEYERTIKDLRTKVKQLEATASKLSATAASAKQAPGMVDEKAVAAAVEKAKKDVEKKAKTDREEAEKESKREIDSLTKRLTKTTSDLESTRASLATLTAEYAELKKRASAADEMEKEMSSLRDGVAQAKQLQESLKVATARTEELEGLYREEQTLRKRYFNALEDLKGKIRVYARVRPLSNSELDRKNKIVVNFPDESTVDLDIGSKGVKSFVYDRAFQMVSTQDDVFAECDNLVQSAYDGYNVCIFAYGQTGSGKTHTMVGSSEMPGLTPRAVSRLFELINKNASVFEAKVSAYMVELYNDNLLDLLLDARTAKSGDVPKLEIKKDDKGVVTIRGVTMKECSSASAVMEVFTVGNSARHVGATLMNAASSRSHLVFALLIDVFNKQTKRSTVGKISLVDLAGSERVGKTGATADRLKEAQAINKSLSALGNVISALSTGEKFIPYRDNKLTQLLSDGLGGNAKTLMFVNLSPADYNADESVSSLVYASRVKLITNSAEKQVENAEIQRLKKIIAQLRSGKVVPAAVDIGEGDGEDGKGSSGTSGAGSGSNNNNNDHDGDDGGGDD